MDPPDKKKQLNQLQLALVRQILLLPDDLMEAVIQTSRARLREEIIMEIGDATAVCSNAKMAHNIQQHLFQTFLMDE